VGRAPSGSRRVVRCEFEAVEILNQVQDDGFDSFDVFDSFGGINVFD
jgi:hypothetical protein